MHAVFFAYSKAALKITSGPELPSTAKVNRKIKSKNFSGDILLHFVHKTKSSSPKVKQSQRKSGTHKVATTEHGEEDGINPSPQVAGLNRARNADDR